jgi:3D (Asp-Asp-Asp) domain-containing protein
VAFSPCSQATESAPHDRGVEAVEAGWWGGLVRAGLGWLSEIIAEIVHDLKLILPMALGLGCQGPTVEPIDKRSPTGMSITASELEPAPTEDPKPLGKFTITFYYVIGEDEVVSKAKPKQASPANDNVASDAEVLVATAERPDLVTLYESDHCDAIAEVSHEFAQQLAIQGTGKLRDGRVLNIWGSCKCGHSPCFRVTQNQWGTAGSGKPLQPFRTVAVDPKVVKLGSLLYVPLLDGKTMPGRPPSGGFVHDGCVVADDTGGHIDGNRLDLFVGRKGYFIGLSGTGASGDGHSWARNVPVFDGSEICERKGRHVARKSAAI